MILEFIDTAKGNQLLEQLQREGWRLRAQYSPLAFDKGIDYDSYQLTLNDKVLLLEWDNWFEWKLTGSQELLVSLKQRFSLP